jgi:hypothetical protein
MGSAQTKNNNIGADDAHTKAVAPPQGGGLRCSKCGSGSAKQRYVPSSRREDAGRVTSRKEAASKCKRLLYASEPAPVSSGVDLKTETERVAAQSYAQGAIGAGPWLLREAWG